MNKFLIFMFLFKVILFMIVLIATLPVTIFFKQWLSIGVINFIYRACDECLNLGIATQKQVNNFIGDIGL